MVFRVLAVLTAVVATAGAGLLVAFTARDRPMPYAGGTPTASASASPTGVAALPSPSPSFSPSPSPSASPSPSPSPSASPSPSPSPPAADPPAAAVSSHPRVTSRLQHLMTRTDPQGTLAVAVYDDDGRPVYRHNAARPLIPASTQKLTVAAAALVRLRPEHRYTTTVAATARPSPGGVVRGDLVLIGGGDPALAGPDFARVEPERPRTRLEVLARRVRRAGIRRVTGDIVGDPTVLEHQPVPAGWPGRYFDSLDATRISGLTVDAGRRIDRSGGELRGVPAVDPAAQAARVFRRLLRDRGVRVAGSARAAHRPPAATAEVTSISSPPLKALLRYMVRRSDNHLADTIFRTVGQHSGDSTWVGAAAATADALAPLRLSWEKIVLADGSGLSRSNRLTADFLARLEAGMGLSDLQRQWFDLLAVSGRRGTLRDRFRGTVAEQRVYGKTGSLRDVTALVGTVAGTKSRRLHFAMVGNRLRSTSATRAVTDRAVMVLAEELQDCRRVRPPRTPRRKRPPPVRLVCPPAPADGGKPQTTRRRGRSFAPSAARPPTEQRPEPAEQEISTS